MDQTDIRILNELSNNSRISMKQLGEKIHLSGQATATRVAKLEEGGIIESYTININQSKLKCYIHAFLTIYRTSLYHDRYNAFINEKKEYVLNNYKISGDGCYLLECRFPTNEHLDGFLSELSEHANYKLSIIVSKQR